MTVSQIRRWALFIGYCSLLITLTACARADDTWNRVIETGTLRVGMDASFPPFEFVAADGSLAGLDVALARELGRRLGVDVQFVANLPYDGLYDALTADRVDVVISALVVNPDRMADFAYSASYFDAGQVLVVQGSGGAGGQGSGGAGGRRPGTIEGMADLSGRVLAVEFGTRGDMEARKWAERLPDLIVAPYQTAADALAAVVAGEADAALVDRVSALDQTLGVSENPKGFELYIVGEPVVGEPCAVAARKESQRLLQEINEALADMEADGTLEMLVKRWVLFQ